MELRKTVTQLGYINKVPYLRSVFTAGSLESQDGAAHRLLVGKARRSSRRICPVI
jgi:hypothetical protein